MGTWAKKEEYKAAIDSSARQHAGSHGLEIRLFYEMLATINDYVAGNESSWASVIYGFDSYAREKAILYAHGAAAKFQGNVYGMRSPAQGLWTWAASSLWPVGSIFGEKDVGSPLPDGTISITLQAFNIVKNGPQIFNRSWYEGAWGKPPIPWESYSPGWQTPK